MRRHPPACIDRRRGFTMLLVIGLMAMAATVIAFNLRRITFRAGVVQRQVEQYELHHEIQGVRDIVLLWLSNPAVRSDLTEHAGSEDPAHTVTMADGLSVRVYVRDGQGTLLANLTNATDLSQRELMITALSRLPENRPDLIRRSGPMEMSFYAMPHEVIEAISSDPQVAEALKILQTDPEITRANISARVSDLGGSMEAFQRIRQAITFTPELWGLDVVAFDPGADEAEDQYRLYTVLAQVRGPLPVIFEWRPVDRDEFQRLRQHATGSAR
jgi:hypothetical protein